MPDACAKDPGLLTLPHALQNILSTITAVTGTEVVSLHDALGRSPAETVTAPENLPAFPNAAMDGYALQIPEDKLHAALTLPVVGTAYAGRPYAQPCLTDQCIRIFTGAMIPDGANCLIMQELVTRDQNLAIFKPPFKPGQYIRIPGEDVRQGDKLLEAGKAISAADLALLAANGIYKIKVRNKLRIAFFSTGDELTPLGTTLDPGHIYDSNRYMLLGLLQGDNHELFDLGVLADDPITIKQSLLDAAQYCDVIITTGGASVGEADFIHPILNEIGNVNFWKLAVKPGKPVLFGQIQASYFFALPGNPVSVAVSVQQILRPALQQLAGLQQESTISLRAKCLDTLKKHKGRMEFQRGIFQQQEDGTFTVQSSGKQASHIISSLSQANCYIVLDEDQESVSSGDWVTIQPFVLLEM